MSDLMLRIRIPAAAVLVAIAAGTLVAAGPDAWNCQVTSSFDVMVDGVRQSGARVYEPEYPDVYLIDIPSQPTALLVYAGARQAVEVSRWDIKPGATPDACRLTVPDRSTAKVYPVSVEGSALRFRTGTCEVRLVKAAEHSPFAGSGGDTKPITPSAEARACLRLESLPAPAGTPGCAKFVHLRNTCAVPVVADMSRTEHLLTGTLPETYRLIVAPSSEQSLGCEWWSGATAPSENAIRSAGFVPEPDKHGHGNKDHASRH